MEFGHILDLISLWMKANGSGRSMSEQHPSFGLPSLPSPWGPMLGANQQQFHSPWAMPWQSLFQSGQPSAPKFQFPKSLFSMMPFTEGV